MSILIDQQTRILVQGITGRDGSLHAKLMNVYSGKVVAGVTPGKGGQEVHGIPVYDTVRKAILDTGANTSVVFVPGKNAFNAVEEAIKAGVKLIIIITEGVPVHDVIRLMHEAEDYDCRLIGPNTPGMLVPDSVIAGIIPATIANKGKIGLVSRSGTLTYLISSDICKSGLGISTAIGIGGDLVVGTRIVEVVEMFESDDQTEGIVLIGEVGGYEEQRVSQLVEEGKIKKPIVAYVAGVNAPLEKRMGHAGAIVSGKGMSAKDKIESLKSVGVKVVSLPWEVPNALKECLGWT
jgi:succinyl-CoA synthetase alpha subunit